jgi:hypothetical protein
MNRRLAVVAALVTGIGCAGEGEPADVALADEAGAETTTDVLDAATDETASDATGDADAAADADAPAVFTREERGEPVTAAEITAVTQKYLGLLKRTRYFENLEERLHGWPESEPTGYWYGTWWSGVSVTKKGGKVTYLHSADGADNNGMRTAPMLDGACYAWSLWGEEGYGHIVRKIVRGFIAWVLAMENAGHPEVGLLMTRASYTPPVASTDGGRELYIDTSLNLPGEDNDSTVYVHNPSNPYWGDIWVKNKRSKDDIGHMLLAIATLPACAGLADADLKADLAKLGEMYGTWCRRVEDDGWRIATVDKDWKVYWPDEDLAYFYDFGNIECKAMLAVRLYGRGDGGTLDCGNGLSPLDEDPALKNDFNQINRSFHEAAAALAFLNGHTDLANLMIEGLAWRVEKVLDGKESPTPPANPNDSDAAELLISTQNAGLPLTWREVRFLHARIADADAAWGDPTTTPALDLFSPATPDGTYPFDLSDAGIAHRYLGALLGTCASAWRNPTSKPVLDCELVKKGLTP